jgi:acetyl-CoA C-acetyltransferase
MASNDRTPVIVGAADWTAPRGPDGPPSPTITEMLVSVARAAVHDAGSSSAMLGSGDALVLVPCVYNDTADRAAAVAASLGVEPRIGVMTSYGGDAGLTAVNWAAEAIEAGQIDVAILAGGQLRLPAPEADLPAGGAPADRRKVGDQRFGFSESEGRHGALLPHATYAMVETALRARHDLPIDEHRKMMGELMSPLSAVAACNANAWFPVERSPDELATPTAANRMVSYPYTKYFNAVTTDQAAALVMMSATKADGLGIARDRRAYWWGGDGEVETAWFFSSRPDYAECPAMQLAQRGALARAGITLDRVDGFDFYSCFPSAVQMAQDMAGLARFDGRPLTLTGGLPYAGGPGAAYTLVAAAAALEQVRTEPHKVLMLSGTGFTFTKNSVSVLSGRPRPPRDEAAPERRTDLERTPAPVDDEPTGRGRVDAYTVMHDRSGDVEYGVVLGMLDRGERFLAHLPRDAAVYRSFEEREGVGRVGVVSPGARGEPNRFEPEE